MDYQEFKEMLTYVQVKNNYILDLLQGQKKKLTTKSALDKQVLLMASVQI